VILVCANPWRIPYTLDSSMLDNRDRIAVITPLLHWVDVMEPGDIVELYEPERWNYLGQYVLHVSKKSLIWTISEKTLNMWMPGANAEDAAMYLTSVYGEPYTKHSCVAVLRLCKVDDLAKAHEWLTLSTED
jgi:hypothetical protein